MSSLLRVATERPVRDEALTAAGLIAFAVWLAYVLMTWWMEGVS